MATQPASRDLPIQPQPISNYSCGEVIFIAIATIVALAGILGIVSQYVSALQAIRFSYPIAITLTAVGIIALVSFYLCRQKEGVPALPKQPPISNLSERPIDVASLVRLKDATAFRLQDYGPVCVSELFEPTVSMHVPDSFKTALSEVLAAKGLSSAEAKQRILAYTKGHPFDFPISRTYSLVVLRQILSVLLDTDQELLSRSVESVRAAAVEMKEPWASATYLLYIQLRLNLVEKPKAPTLGTLGEVLTWDVEEIYRREDQQPDDVEVLSYLLSCPQIAAFLESLEVNDQGMLKRGDGFAYKFLSGNQLLTHDSDLGNLKKRALACLRVSKINELLSYGSFRAYEWISLDQLKDPSFKWELVPRLHNVKEALQLNIGDQWTTRGHFDHLEKSVQGALIRRFPELNNMPPRK